MFYGAGPRWTPLATYRWSPFAEFLFGGRKVGCEVDNPELENQLLSDWSDGSGTLPHDPKRSDWSTQIASNGSSLAVIHPDNGFRITTEAVLRIGTW